MKAAELLDEGLAPSPELIGCVYQRPALITQLTVAENLFLNRLTGDRSTALVRWRQVESRAAELLSDWDFEISPRALVSQLTIAERQLLEIARALSRGTRVVILDEPTADLERREIDRLFERIHRLKQREVTFLYISHHLQELFEVCEEISVLRDGRRVLTERAVELTESDVARAMVGGEVPITTPNAAGSRERIGISDALVVSGLTVPGAFRDVSFTVHAGERVGLAGLASSGALSLGRALGGLLTPTEGSVRVHGRTARMHSPADAISMGIGYVSEDRHRDGFVPRFGVEENITAGGRRRFVRHGLIRHRSRAAFARSLATTMQVKVSGMDQEVRSLSGGNQQKVVVGRALSSEPSVLVLSHPTTGVDIASKQVLMSVIVQKEEQGCAVMVISDEFEELSACDRVLIMSRGALVAELRAPYDEATVIAEIERMHQE